MAWSVRLVQTIPHFNVIFLRASPRQDIFTLPLRPNASRKAAGERYLLGTSPPLQEGSKVFRPSGRYTAEGFFQDS